MPKVEWRTPDDGQRNRPKHIEFLDKNKFEKISASVGFIKKKFVTMHGHMNIKISHSSFYKLISATMSLWTLSWKLSIFFVITLQWIKIK